jgi:RNA polymerase sigma-70 factor (ECF subfamily)
MPLALTPPPAFASDLELAARHRSGDGGAFDEIYQRHAAMIYNLALRLAGDPDEAADLAQEVLVRVFRHLGRFQGHSSLKTWIYRVAVNHCRSRLGRRRPPPASLDADPAGRPREPADPRRGPAEEAEAGDAGRRVAAALARLPAAFREAVVLRDLEGLAYEEIAQVLGVRPGTVRSRIARGRDQLRALLVEEAR